MASFDWALPNVSAKTPYELNVTWNQQVRSVESKSVFAISSQYLRDDLNILVRLSACLQSSTRALIRVPFYGGTNLKKGGGISSPIST